MKIYEYRCELYFGDDEIETAIELREGGEYNNRPVPDHIFESVMRDEVTTVDPNDFEVYKTWCERNNRKPGHEEALRCYINMTER